MKKIPLLLNTGVSFAATTPLWYTLQWDNKICHTGNRKKTHWLTILQFMEAEKYGINQYVDINGRTWHQWAKKHEVTPFEKPSSSKPAHLQKSTFTLEEEIELYSLPTSIDKYIEYFTRHYHNLNGEYKYGADFSNKNCTLFPEFLMDIRDNILEVFDVKVTMIFRDPIRRIWSNNYCNMEKVFHKDAKKKRQWHYDEMYKNHANAWGKENVYPIIMEDVWQDPSGLADFLGVKIDRMHENCYWPEMGMNIPKYQWLRDQYQRELAPIPYDYLRERLDFLYVNFEKCFGYIPKEWRKREFDI